METKKAAGKSPVGFIGQGYVGKNYADDFEARGFTTVRYALEEPYRGNKTKIAECDIVFIGVPTPTTSAGCDTSIVKEALGLVGDGKVAVIKSTIPPGTTRALQQECPQIVVLHNPEFLRESYARQDVEHPDRTIIGIPQDSELYRARAQELLTLLPKAPFELVCDSQTAEFIKYTHNTLGYALIVFANVLYDMAQVHGVAWEPVKNSILHNPWYPEKYLDPVHKGGRGAGGTCFVKDFAALRALYEQSVRNPAGLALLEAYEKKNVELLHTSGKDLDLLRGVYGDDCIV